MRFVWILTIKGEGVNIVAACETELVGLLMLNHTVKEWWKRTQQGEMPSSAQSQYFKAHKAKWSLTGVPLTTEAMLRETRAFATPPMPFSSGDKMKVQTIRAFLDELEVDLLSADEDLLWKIDGLMQCLTNAQDAAGRLLRLGDSNDPEDAEDREAEKAEIQLLPPRRNPSLDAEVRRIDMFGLWNQAPQEGMAWGARAIFSDGDIDLVYDRQSFREGPGDKAEFVKTLNYALTEARKRAKKLYRSDLAGDSQEVVDLFVGDGMVLRASTNASHGYLYMIAFEPKE